MHTLDMQEPRQAAMVYNKAIKFPCDEQTRKAWRKGWQKANTADFCDSGGAAEQAVKALIPCMQKWADALQVTHPILVNWAYCLMGLCSFFGVLPCVMQTIRNTMHQRSLLSMYATLARVACNVYAIQANFKAGSISSESNQISSIKYE